MRYPLMTLSVLVLACASCGASEPPSAESPGGDDPAAGQPSPEQSQSEQSSGLGLPSLDIEQHGVRLALASRARGRHPDPTDAASHWVRAATASMFGPPDSSRGAITDAAPLFVESACSNAFEQHRETGASQSPDASGMIQACRAAYCSVLDDELACTGDPRDARAAMRLFSAILVHDHGLEPGEPTTRFVAWTLSVLPLWTLLLDGAPSDDALLLQRTDDADDQPSVRVTVRGAEAGWDVAQSVPPIASAALLTPRVELAAVTYELPFLAAVGRLLEESESPVHLFLFRARAPNPFESQATELPRWSSLEDERGDGFVDLNRLSARLVSLQGALGDCHERASEAHGRMLVYVTVETSGAVSAEVTENTTGDAGLAACVGTTVSGLAPLEPGAEGGSATVAFPLVFYARR